MISKPKPNCPNGKGQVSQARKKHVKNSTCRSKVNIAWLRIQLLKFTIELLTGNCLIYLQVFYNSFFQYLYRKEITHYMETSPICMIFLFEKKKNKKFKINIKVSWQYGLLRIRKSL